LLTKEEKVLKVLKNREYLMFKEIRKLTNLSETQLYRAIHNLLNCEKIQKIGRGKYATRAKSV
jgi:predicted transcriptional regulator